VQNDSGAPMDLADSFGYESISIIDVRGELAPVGLYSPPHPCEGPCGEPRPECPGNAGTTRHIEAQSNLRIAWNGSLRRKRRMEGGWPCYERIDAPAGEYIVRACSTDQRCAMTRFEMPRREPVVISVRARETEAQPACDAASVTRALRIAYGRAIQEGIAADAMRGCPTTAACEGAALSGTASDCEVHVGLYHDVYIVTIAPAARDLAPGRIEAWIDGGATMSGNFFVNGGRWAATSDATIAVIGEPQHALHTHGGEGAHIGGATFHVTNRGDVARTLTLRGATWLAHGREEPLANPQLEGGAHEIEVAAHGVRDLTVSFPPQEAYQASGDRFAVQVELEVDGSVLRPQADISVTRVTPLGQ
jgi:hypothetical protein